MQAAIPCGSHESSVMTKPEEPEQAQEAFEAAVAEIDSLESQKIALGLLDSLPGVFARAVIRGAIGVSFDAAFLRSLLNGKPAQC